MRQLPTAWRLGLAAALALAALGLAGCSKQKTTVEPSFSRPEGAPAAAGAAQLVLWREAPAIIEIWQDNLPMGRDDNDRRLSTIPFGTDLPGRIRGLVLDSTAAGSYQILRRDPAGGYAELKDYLTIPTRRWLDLHWESYVFTDDDTAHALRTYIGRGVIGGAVTLTSPLTNEARDTSRVVANVNYTGSTGFDRDGNPVPLDSLFLMEWTAVPGAAGYYVQVYQPSFNLTTNGEQVMSGMPAPLFVGKSRDILLAYLPEPSPPTARVSLRVPRPGASPPRPGAHFMTVRGTNYGQEYRVRVAAVDALGRMIAFTYGSYGLPITADLPDGGTLLSGQYALYRLGAITVVPSR